MKVAILCGGVGTRLAEETEIKPKHMVEVGGRPILWHIMMHYSAHGFDDFVVALGYTGEQIKKYMVDYAAMHGDINVRMRTNQVTRREHVHHDWSVDLVETGNATLTGGRTAVTVASLPWAS